MLLRIENECRNALTVSYLMYVTTEMKSRAGNNPDPNEHTLCKWFLHDKQPLMLAPRRKSPRSGQAAFKAQTRTVHTAYQQGTPIERTSLMTSHAIIYLRQSPSSHQSLNWFRFGFTAGSLLAKNAGCLAIIRLFSCSNLASKRVSIDSRRELTVPQNRTRLIHHNLADLPCT